MTQRTRKWINLKDNEAKLEVGRLKSGQLILLLSGISPNSPRFKRAVGELGFTSSASGRVMVRTLKVGEPISLQPFRSIWENAVIEEMPISSFYRDIEGELKRIRKRQERRVDEQSKTEEERLREKELELEEQERKRNEAQNYINDSTLIGSNHLGNKVYKHPTDGLFYVNTLGKSLQIVGFNPNQQELFLSGTTDEALFLHAQGVVLHALNNNEDMTLNTIKQIYGHGRTAQDTQKFIGYIHQAAIEHLLDNHSELQQAWNDAVRIQDVLGLSAAPAGITVPLPAAVAAQRFLQNNDSIVTLGHAEPHTYILLDEQQTVYQEQVNDGAIEPRPHLETLGKTQKAQSALINIPLELEVEDVINEQLFSSFDDQGLMVLMTAHHPQDVLDKINELEEVHPIQIVQAPQSNFCLCVLKRGETQGYQLRKGREAVKLKTWDNLRLVVDETLARMGREDLSIFNEDRRADNVFQRPYMAFSQASISSTMTPKNLQAPLASALERIERSFGTVDDFVSEEMELGRNSLSERFTAEQVDAIALGINALLNNKGLIIGDETGIGKGRTLAALATWANKNKKPVIFVTDRANLFSDLARDLKDINEWERFKPLITNADGHIIDMFGESEVPLVQAPTSAQMNHIINGTQNFDHNIILTTYSQMNNEASSKSKWLLEQSKGAVLILDESHCGAGDNSNISRQIEAMIEVADGAIYSSATWAKDYKNLAIYKKALPESVNIGQVQQLMEQEGESFSEVFSAMLAADGALIRREHDLSRIDFVVDEDVKYMERNREVVGKVSEILSLLMVLSGEANNMIQRVNRQTRTNVLEAQKARNQVLEQLQAQLAEKQGKLEKAIETRQDAIDKREGRLFSLESDLSSLLSVQNKVESIKSSTAADDEKAQELNALIEENSTFLHLMHRDTTRLHENAPQELTTDSLESILELSVINFENYIRTNKAKLDELRDNAEIDALEKEIKEFKQDLLNSQVNTSRGMLFESSFGTGSAIYGVMRRVTVALSLEHATESAIEALKNDIKPVIVLDETAGAFAQNIVLEELERAKRVIKEVQERQEKGELSDEDIVSEEIAALLDDDVKAIDVVREVRLPTIQDVLRAELERLGGVKVTEVEIDEEQQSQNTVLTTSHSSLSNFIKEHFSMTDESGESVESIADKYEQGIEEINQLIADLPPLPVSPFDVIAHKIEQAGFSVDEISGREYKLNVSGEHNGEHLGRIELRDRSKLDVTRTVSAFNSGETDVLIINRAAATGVSMHSSPRFKDQRQRQLIEVESDLNPNTRLQMFGRVNRFDQVTPPIITMTYTGLPSETRSIMMQNQKLKSLSANIRSSRDNAIINEEVPDILNRTGDRVCQEYLLEKGGIANRLNIDMGRIMTPYGLASLLTQRIAVLKPDQQEKILNELSDAYEDALIEDEITHSSSEIPLYDWKAKTVEEMHAWGPRNFQDGMSIFNAPVTQRTIIFKETLNPLSFEEVLDKIHKNTHKHLNNEDSQVTVGPVSFSSGDQRQVVYARDLEWEKNATDEEKRAVLASHLFGELLLMGNQGRTLGQYNVINLPVLGTPWLKNAILKYDQENQSALIWSFRDVNGQVQTETLRVDMNKIRTLYEFYSDKQKTSDYFKALSGNSQGQVSLKNEMMAFAQVLNIVSPPADDYSLPSQHIDYADGSWAEQLAKKYLTSCDPSTPILSFEKSYQAAIEGLEARKIINLSGSGFDSIEKALSSPGHNNVKEAHKRQNFIKTFLKKATIGSKLTPSLNDMPYRFRNFFAGKEPIIVNISPPERGQEHSLTKWKFEIVSAGMEHPTVISAATLMKAADSPDGKFQGLRIGSPNAHLLSLSSFNGRQSVQSAFNSFRKGEVTRTKVLLEGNIYQANQWANASKQGRLIAYSDEQGHVHRAVEVNSSALQDGRLLNIAKRLYGKESVGNLLEHIYSSYNDIEYKSNACKRNHFVFARSLEAAINAEKKILTQAQLNMGGNRLDKPIENSVTLITTGDPTQNYSHALDICLPTKERTALRRRFLNTLKQHERMLNEENPDMPYLALSERFHRVESVRGSREDPNRILRIFIPAGAQADAKVAREQILDAFIETHGAELVSIPSLKTSSDLLNKELDRHYEREASPDVDRHKRMLEHFEQRKQARAIMQAAFEEEQEKQEAQDFQPKQKRMAV